MSIVLPACVARIVLFVVAVILFPAAVSARDCSFRPFGLIGERWLELDGADGPLGCPVGEEFVVEGQKDFTTEFTGAAPSLAGHAGRLFLAWKGSGNDALNLILSGNGGISFGSKRTFGETSDRTPALTSDGGGLLLAWKERDDAQEALAKHISIARISLFANTNGMMGIEGIGPKSILSEMTAEAPALASHQGRLYLAWTGVSDRRLNLAVSTDGGRSFPNKRTLDQISDASPALVSTPNGLVLAWKKADSVEIRVARVVIIGNTAGGTGIEGLSDEATTGHQTDSAPTLAFHDGRLFLGWKGAGNKILNIAVARPGSFTFEKSMLADTSDLAPTLASAGRLWMGWRGFENHRLNVASAILIGNTAGGFGIERLQRIAAIKRRFENGEIVWSPAQGDRMLVAAYQQDDNLIVNWGDTAPFEYDKFIVNWDRDGAHAGFVDVSKYIDRTNGFFRLQAPLPARYSFVVEGCNTGIGGSDCPQRWTTSVEVEYRLPQLPAYAGCPPEAQPFGLIGERWAQLGGAEGPLGCPTSREGPVSDRPGATQSFRNGTISFSPQQGEQMLVAAHLSGNDIVVEWGSTAPFSYDKFILRLDKDGVNVLQVDAGKGTGGRWSTPATGPGTYSIIVEGCDTDLTGSDCAQSWTIPVNVLVPVPVPASSPSAPEPECDIPVAGLIRDRWVALGAKNGPMKCPTEAERDVAGRRGKAMRFQNGEIVWSPDQGDRMVVSVFQEGDKLVVDVGDSDPFSYSWFDLRLDYEGVDISPEVIRGARGGRLIIGPLGNEDSPEMANVGPGTGNYTVTVQGCDDASGIPPFDSVECPQGWTVPATTFFQTETDVLDFSGLDVPRNVHDALRDKAERAQRAAIVLADRSDYGGSWGDGQTNNAIATLYLLDRDVARGLPARDRRRFGHRFGMLTEIENAVRVQTIHAKVGTAIGAPCKDSGEYDTVLKGYVVLLYRYGHLLAPDVRYRMLRLMDQFGPHNPDLSSMGCFGVIIPETENHLWLIDSSRFLTNQLWSKQSGDPQFDNRQNGLADHLIRKLQGHLNSDFIEYNSRPYSRYTWMAIQNLYDFSEDPQVKTAAQAVLDYLSTKTAVSMNDGRRNPPYRRRVSNNHADLFNHQADRLKKRFLAYTGPTRTMGELRQPNHVEHYAAPEILLATATDYQPPNLVLDFMVNSATRSYYQRFNARGSESYAAEPDFLISGGGAPADYAYEVVGTGLNEDLGVEQPTALIPTGDGTTINQMIRFAGVSNDRFRPAGLCVAPGFACGMRPTIPPRYTAKAECVIARGAWTFIDAATDACRTPNTTEYGFYAAVWGAGTGFGILEAVPRSKISNISLRRFADRTIARNRGRTFNQTDDNRYAAFGGNEIRFTAGLSTPMVQSTGIAAIDGAIRNTDPAGNRLAAGTVMNSTPGLPAMTIRNDATGEVLILDLTDTANPTRVLLEPDPLRRLLGRGIVYSVSEAEIRDWLGNVDTPYPALAAALERDFPDGGLSRPVDIDVVRWYYEEGQGAISPRRLEEVDRRVLENALIAAHNSRYGEKVTRIEQIRRGPPSQVSARSPVEQAIDAVARHNRAWSQPNAMALQDLELMYSPRVEFYDSNWSRDRVMEEKREFASRWPMRDYHFRPDMSTSVCDASNSCIVQGLVEWYARDPVRNATSVGTAEVSIGLQLMGDAFVISKEDGRVISRR
ncbi:hypothetical protein [Sinorhizobium sp. BG8]|uniref:LGFP repeat-containing protein n=1 Tax=Sinorhizobium sp. BG8 TaxID=2613773 RepID=UPI00193E0E67|nr:hypothetical protein [Sinorhizobium sp. BG8]QRM53818.1 hypothetical protein F3Y30_04040 [Sinorhizobium sp. BG8]